jgi:hypothetical protein
MYMNILCSIERQDERRVFEQRANSISSTGLSIPRAAPEDPNNHGCREGEDGEPRAVDAYTMA